MIETFFHTNLDLFNEEWPRYMPCVPMVGHCVKSKTKRDSGFALRLEVHQVAWVYVENRPHKDDGWYPKIELHISKAKENWSIRDFYEWYAPLVGKRTSYFI